MPRQINQQRVWPLGLASLILIVTLFGCGFLLLRSCGFSIYFPRQIAAIENIYIDDPYVRQLELEFSLSKAVAKYDEIIAAIESYRQDNLAYPQKLEDLVPEYIDRSPGIIIRNGDELMYLPTSQWPYTVPFTFSISGDHLGLAFIHGWTLLYCPKVFDSCNTGGHRKRSETRINDDWIWINSSAL